MTPRIRDVLPELVAYISAGLQQQGRRDLESSLDSAVIYRVDYSSSSFGLHLVPDLDIDAFLADLDREAIHIRPPHGIRRRRWVVGLGVVRGRIWTVGVSHPGVLREPARQLAAQLRD
jgi:hypothetical protein